MEPVTLIIGGVALYGYLRGSATPASTLPAGVTPGGALAATGGNTPIGTVTGADIATNTSTATGAAGSGGLQDALNAPVVPSSLTVALDNDSAMMMRAYAALNPADFQAFLDKYAAYLALRSDLYLEALQAPPPGGFQPTPGMLVSLGSAAYKVVQALNGVAVGRYGDIFGAAASAAGSLPMINRDFVSSLQGVALGYRAISSLSQVMDMAAANGVSVLDFTAMVSAGAYPGLAALPLTGVLMAVGLVVDVVFTIMGDAPDIQKAIDVALDVASLAVLFIPVIGVVIAIVIQLVKFIIDLFGSDLFGGGLSHEQREVLETARYGDLIHPMYQELSDAYTPREIWRALVQWGSGYCGGSHQVAMSTALPLKAGDQLTIGGVLVTLPADNSFTPGDNDRAGGCYWLRQDATFGPITNDEQAWAIAKYAPVNGFFAMAQAGIADWRKVQFDDPVVKIVTARCTPMKNFLDHHLTLDQIDQVALEYRAQPHLNQIATCYAYPDWQTMVGDLLAAEWSAFTLANAQGSLSDFARSHGYGTMYAFRAAAMGSWATYVDRAIIAAASIAEKVNQSLITQAQAARDFANYMGNFSSGGGGP